MQRAIAHHSVALELGRSRVQYNTKNPFFAFGSEVVGERGPRRMVSVGGRSRRQQLLPKTWPPVSTLSARSGQQAQKNPLNFVPRGKLRLPQGKRKLPWGLL